ncbi:MAG: hypothetical protein NPIRA02_41460 [Nitrospirales bacterium]|nr:MAG: hypothetical protein NPIRA02_41460 [Nitrospirales bacterium]
MNQNPKEQTIHPDELLPWLVNGTLEGAERQEVEQHLQSCQQCQQEIVLLQKMREQVKKASSQTSDEVGLNRLLHEIRTQQNVNETQEAQQSGWWRTGLAIAAVLIMFIQAGLLIDTWYLSKPMVPLAGPHAQGRVLQVSFTPTATESQIREVLTDIHATFIDGPSSLGIYHIRLDPHTGDEPSLQQMIEQLRQHTTIIQHVAQDEGRQP